LLRNWLELRAAVRANRRMDFSISFVHDSYFVGDRVVPYDDLYHFEEKP